MKEPAIPIPNSENFKVFSVSSGFLKILLNYAKIELSHKMHLPLNYLCKDNSKYSEFKILPYGDLSFNQLTIISKSNASSDFFGPKKYLMLH